MSIRLSQLLPNSHIPTNVASCKASYHDLKLSMIANSYTNYCDMVLEEDNCIQNRLAKA